MKQFTVLLGQIDEMAMQQHQILRLARERMRRLSAVQRAVVALAAFDEDPALEMTIMDERKIERAIRRDQEMHEMIAAAEREAEIVMSRAKHPANLHVVVTPFQDAFTRFEAATRHETCVSCTADAGDDGYCDEHRPY